MECCSEDGMINSTPWARRSHPGPCTVRLKLSAEERAQFEAALRPATAEKRVVMRAQAVLLMADGVPAIDIAMLVGAHMRTVEKWRARFSCKKPVEKLADAPRSGRPPSLFRTQTVQKSSRKHAANRATSGSR